MQNEPRRSPHDRSCFIVRDNNGQALAYCFYEQEPGRRATARLRGAADIYEENVLRPNAQREYLSLWHSVEHGIDRLSHGGRCIM